jgi:hypothetical protein
MSKWLDYLGGSNGHTISVLLLSVLTTGLLVTHHVGEATWQNTIVWLFGTYGAGGAVAAYRDSFKPS